MSLWKNIRHRIESAALRFSAWLVPQLSHETCRRLANGLGEFVSRLDRRGRATALENVRCAFGDTLTHEQRLEIVHASYRNFARTMLDLLWAPTLAKPENRHLLRIEVWPGYDELLRNRGGVYISAHFGNWEYTSIACAWAGRPAIAVAEHLKNPVLAEIITHCRQVSGQMIIPQENSMLRMMKTVKRGGFTGLLTDLTLRPGQASTVIRAFGMEMCVSVLHAVLAQRVGAVIMPLTTLPDADGGYTYRLHPPIEPPPGATLQQIAQMCWDYFEPLIRKQPGLWLWPYKHFRYRPRATTQEYPEYANESGAFEKLRKREMTPAPETELPKE